MLLLLSLNNCNNSPEINKFLDSSKSKSTDSHVKYSEADLDSLTAGEGITVGNGRENTEDVKDDKTESFFLACSLSQRNNFRCNMSKDFGSQDYSKDKIKVLDDKGQQIPAEFLVYKIIVEINGEKWLEISVNSEATAKKIIVDGIDKTTDESVETEVDKTIEVDDASNSGPQDCNEIGDPGTWISVPGDPDYGTSDFCVMKYEAKNTDNSPVSEAVGNPWVFISQQDAITVCSSLGQGYHLISNDEWMTIAANLAGVAGNWTGGNIGAGMLYIGHSDRDPESVCPADADDAKSYVETDCAGKNTGGDDDISLRRTHNLSNGQVIWDLSGNVREWTSFENLDKPSPQITDYIEFTEPIGGSASLPLNRLVPTQAVKAFWSDSWNSSQGIGMAQIGSPGTGGELSRGGGFKGMERNGIFRFRIDQDASILVDTLGFRCTYSIP